MQWYNDDALSGLDKQLYSDMQVTSNAWNVSYAMDVNYRNKVRSAARIAFGAPIVERRYWQQ